MLEPFNDVKCQEEVSLQIRNNKTQKSEHKKIFIILKTIFVIVNWTKKTTNYYFY